MPTSSTYYTMDRLKQREEVLVVNSGSSSLKVTLFNCRMTSFERLFDVHLKGIHSTDSRLNMTTSEGSENIIISQEMGIQEGLEFIFDYLETNGHFEVSSLKAIGHRYVHGGKQYISSTNINDEVILNLEKLSYLAPLHNEACLLGIKSCRNHFGKSIPQIAVFDTAFHSSMPQVAAQYAIAADISSKYQIKRYGFHGISNAFAWSIYKKSREENSKNEKIIVMHLGNGCSMTAIQGGSSIDTSMGFTPAEGLVMGTRAGDIDAGVVEFLCLHDKKTAVEAMEELNLHSGLLGISGTSSNMEVLLKKSEKEEKAQFAIEMFCYRIVKYLGAYIAVLGGVEALIFTGGIGENSPKIRQLIIDKMAWHGIKLCENANKRVTALSLGKIEKISSSSTVDVYVVATDENLFIAKEVMRLIAD